MTKTIAASAAYAEIVSQVEKIKNDEHANLATMSPGDVLRQGDLYLVCLDKAILGGKPSPSRQLAPGNTQGSRHVAQGDCDVMIVDEKDATKAINRLIPTSKGHTLFVGPMIVARGNVLVEHPEHGDRTIPGDSCYLVTYQKAWANEIRRTLD